MRLFFTSTFFRCGMSFCGLSVAVFFMVFSLSLAAQVDTPIIGNVANGGSPQESVNIGAQGTLVMQGDSVVAASSFNVDAILTRVMNANRSYSFHGLLTFETEGTLSSLSLHQFIDRSDLDNRIYQRLEFLDGESRRVVRDQGLRTCESGQTRWGLWPSVFDIELLKQHYLINMVGVERVASRQTYRIELIPKDQFRYGYHFNIDQQTGLLLRTAVMEGSNVLERSQFVNLRLLADDAIDSSEIAKGISWRVPEVGPCHTEQFKSAWSAQWIPEGFVFAGNRVTAQGEQVLIFTDGLATVSVFITSVQYSNLPKMTARRGATVAVMSPFDRDKTIVVVGEIPTVTARRIAVSIRSE